MKSIIPFLLLYGVVKVKAVNLNYLDPNKLQTRSSPDVQKRAAYEIISRYISSVSITINPLLFVDNKDVFTLRTDDKLYITASTGVAAVWGFNYFLKKYCKSQIAWQNERVEIPNPLPDVDEVVVANDRFRYYQNVRTASNSFVWWSDSEWMKHVEWMALNGINLALAPVAQEAAWANVYRQIGMTDEEIDDHLTGPAYLPWLRMGNIHGWGGPLLKSWHDLQKKIQGKVIIRMFELGMIPVLPAFNGHVPEPFTKIFPNARYHTLTPRNLNCTEYCITYFLHPSNPEFKYIGKKFLNELTTRTGLSHMYIVDPFNDVNKEDLSQDIVEKTAAAIYETLKEVDKDAVWILQNSMFLDQVWHASDVQSFLTSVPNGRMLVLDLQSERIPLYEKYSMYFGQPFIWCMLHNFGGTLGMFGNMEVINTNVYKARDSDNSTMIGIGLTPEGINQNYVMYDLMLESAWRRGPVQDLKKWVGDYAERRYGCNNTASAWKYLLRSVYSYDGQNKVSGLYVITSRPSFKMTPWAWYSSRDLFDALKRILFAPEKCFSSAYYHDVVDITRQCLQYRAEQLYMRLKQDMYSPWAFNSSVSRFLEVMNDMEDILSTNIDFSASNWFYKARSIGENYAEAYLYELSARNQVTVWGPDSINADYACKQWSNMFKKYYIPRWKLFLTMALEAVVKGDLFDEDTAQSVVRSLVEEAFRSVDLLNYGQGGVIQTALKIYGKWAHVSELEDLPLR